VGGRTVGASLAGVAKLVNAAVFKTASLQDCGFKSRRPHLFSTLVHRTIYVNGSLICAPSTISPAPTGAEAAWGAFGSPAGDWIQCGSGFDSRALHHEARATAALLP
jgi:hypothetical protein